MAEKSVRTLCLTIMERCAALCCLAAVLSCAVADRAPAVNVPAPREFQRLEETWNTAHLKGDVETLERLWADDIVIAVPKMPLFGKAQLLAMWRSRAPEFSKYETSNIVVREYGDTAVVTGRLRRTRDFGGRIASDDWQFTKVYVRRGSAWRVASYHASESPETPMH